MGFTIGGREIKIEKVSRWDDLFINANYQQSTIITNVPNGTRIVVASDTQIPLEDNALCNVIFGEFAEWYRPIEGAEYHLFLNGDVLDNFSLSRFLKRVQPKFTHSDELDITRKALERWGKHFTHKHYVFGNHEDRWEKYLWDNAPAVAASVPSLAEVLCLEDLGYDWVPYLKHYELEGFIITHGNRTTSYAAKAMYDQYHTSGTSGHTNRPQSYTFADAASGEPDSWYVTGMLCRKDIGDVIKFKNEDEITHNVYSITSGNEFEIKVQKPGETGTVEINPKNHRKGKMEVECAIHPNMKLLVNIKK